MNSDCGGVLVQAKTHRQGWKLDLQCKCLVCDKRAASLCGVCTGHCDFRLCVLNTEWILSNFRLISMPTSYCKTKFCLEELFWGMFTFGTNVHVVVPHEMFSAGPSSIKSLILHKVQRIMFLLTYFCSIGHTVWLDPLVERQHLKGSQTTINKMYIRSELLHNGYAVDNEQVCAIKQSTGKWMMCDVSLGWVTFLLILWLFFPACPKLIWIVWRFAPCA